MGPLVRNSVDVIEHWNEASQKSGATFGASRETHRNRPRGVRPRLLVRCTATAGREDRPLKVLR
ncbi:MAG: hypothetical protein LC777_08040, partial [Actinobacteria bacterium]|nr:hypothetical protein [Actinomycetota bacterium]